MLLRKEFIMLTAASSLCGIFSCKGPAPTAPQTTLADFYITTQVAGWVRASNSPLVILPVENLYHAVDGDAALYQNAGLENWFIEYMYGGSTHTDTSGDYDFNGYVEEYGSAASSKAIFDKITAVHVIQNSLDTTFSDTVPLAGFSLAEAQAVRVQGGIDVYATFDKYFFSLEFTGYADPTTAAPDAVKFLTAYKALAQ
jgi:hypothetical protein